MSRLIGIVSAILIASTAVVQAQGSRTQSVSRDVRPAHVLGQTGTMYDGDNAKLQLPSEPNGYWADLWAAPISAEDFGPAGAAAAGSPGSR